MFFKIQSLLISRNPMLSSTEVSLNIIFQWKCIKTYRLQWSQVVLIALLIFSQSIIENPFITWKAAKRRRFAHACEIYREPVKISKFSTWISSSPIKTFSYLKLLYFSQDHLENCIQPELYRSKKRNAANKTPSISLKNYMKTIL